MKLNELRSKVQTDETELTRQAKKQTEYKLLGDHIKTIDGGRIWKINKETRTIEEAIYRESEMYVIGQEPIKKIDIEPNHWYVEALNRRNVLKKLKQGNIILST